MTLRLNGDDSGFTEIKAPNAAGDNSITLPTSNGSANQLLQNGGTAGALQYTNAGGGLHYTSSGRLLVGHPTNIQNQSMQVVTNNGGAVGLYKYGNNDDGSEVTFFTSRNGTKGVHGLVSDGDYLGRIFFRGSSGTAYERGVEVAVRADGDPSETSMPGRLEIMTTSPGDTTPTLRMFVGSNGALNLSPGCPGIDFSRIQDNQSGMASETLANYERGSFTPSFEGISAFDYSARTGSYVRVGEIVTVYIRLSTINAGGVSGTDTVKITGLPFPVRFSGNAGLNCLALTHDSRFINNPQFGQVQSGSQTKIVLFKDKSMNAASDGLTSADFTKTNTANFNLMSINFTYEIDLS